MKTAEASLEADHTPHRPRLVPSSVTLVDVTAEARGFDDFSEHRRVWEVRDDRVALHGFLAVHDTTLGPALGGCRMVPYASREAALTDALRLSRGMTLKAALAGLDLGGGKAVLIGDPGTDKTEALFRGFGAAVDRLGGEYVTGEDVGTSVHDMDWVARGTAYVIGTSEHGGDPADITALGVCEGIRAAVGYRTGSDRLAGVTVAVQGLGHVGHALCRQLAAAGARLVVADLDRERIARVVDEFDADVVPPARIHRAEADVFAPCALGGVLDERTIPELRCAIVAGSANNQLVREAHGEMLRRRGILFAPDYVINAGGLISVGLGFFGEDPKGAVVVGKVRRIGATLAQIFDWADARGVAPGAIANELALKRIEHHREKQHRVA